jgi:hypothetical protein
MGAMAGTGLSSMVLVPCSGSLFIVDELFFPWSLLKEWLVCFDVFEVSDRSVLGSVLVALREEKLGTSLQMRGLSAGADAHTMARFISIAVQ